MTCRWTYGTPEGFSDLVMLSDGEALLELSFSGSHGAKMNLADCEMCELPVFRETCRWLDLYFGGRQPDFTPPYRIQGLTPFRKDVLDIVRNVPFGETITYGEIAGMIARRHGSKRMSARAVGGAVGWNPLCLIIPCHRVVGHGRRLVGYGGGIENKVSLLALEGHRISAGRLE